MLLITHALVGATVARKIKNPFLSLPLILILHFLMDYIPHWDLGTDFRKRIKFRNFILAFIDGSVALLIVFFIYQYQKYFSPILWLGFGTSLLPDFLEAPSLFLGISILPGLDRFHSNLSHQENQNLFWGLLPQIIIIFISLSWLFFL
jgi:hypothetical protein